MEKKLGGKENLGFWEKPITPTFFLVYLLLLYFFGNLIFLFFAGVLNRIFDWNLSGKIALDFLLLLSIVYKLRFSSSNSEK